MPDRKSFFWNAVSASRRKAAAGLPTVPASLLICASSFIAASSSVLCLNGFSAASADAATDARTMVRSAAASPARTARNIGRDLRKERIAASMISGPDDVGRVADGDAGGQH